MRRVEWVWVMLALAASLSFAKQSSTPGLQDGPLAIRSQPDETPKPDADGVYRIGPGITTPVVVKAVEAVYPADAREEDRPNIRIFAVVIGADGKPSGIHPVFPGESPFDAGAIEAIRQSTFQPGLLKDKPVPVLVHVRVPFFHLKPALPSIQEHYAQLRSQDSPPDPLRMQPGDTHPVVLQRTEQEYSDEARKQKIQGSVTLSLVVTADGDPAEIRVVKPMGHGLDEKAVEAVEQYKFRPAMRGGKPVPVRIMMVIDFKLY